MRVWAEPREIAENAVMSSKESRIILPQRLYDAIEVPQDRHRNKDLGLNLVILRLEFDLILGTNGPVLNFELCCAAVLPAYISEEQTH